MKLDFILTDNFLNLIFLDLNSMIGKLIGNDVSKSRMKRNLLIITKTVATTFCLHCPMAIHALPWDKKSPIKWHISYISQPFCSKVARLYSDLECSLVLNVY